MDILTKNAMKVVATGEQREGWCKDCNCRTVKEFYMDGERERVRMTCPECGGLGRLIVKTYSVQPPRPPTCLKPGCIWRFMLRVEYCDLLVAYHAERVKYATQHRHKHIPEKYRTGEPSPSNIKETIKAIIKLKIEKIRR